jgi:hypothetical protein
VLAVERVEREAEQRPVTIANAESRELESLRRQAAGHPDGVEYVQRVCVDHGRAGRVLPFRELVDQHVPDAGLLQGGCERQSGGARANDQDVGFCREHRFLHKSTCVDI